MTNELRLVSSSTSGLALLAVTLLTCSPSAAEAQLADASASALAMAGNNTASARGFQAISVNPAGLGMPGSGFSLALVPVQVRVGLDPIAFGDLVDFEGQLVPTATKEEWLDRVVSAGGQSGTVGADASLFALTLGNIGFQVSTVAAVDLTMPPGLVEAYLFGNAGRTGSPVALSLLGASIESFATTTAAMSFALPVSPSLVLGMTGKHTTGHGLVLGRSEGGSFDVDPIQATLDFPMVTTCVDEVVCTQDYVGGGSGFGIDIGAIIDLESITLGASIQNVVNSFAWDESTLGYRTGSLTLTGGDYEADYDELAYASAPADLKAVVSDFTFKPAYRLGAALEVSPRLTVTGDLHGLFADDGISVAPDYHVGVGAELRLPVVHLRAGITKITEAMQYGAGASLVLGPVNLSLAGGLAKGGLGDTVMGQFALSFGNR